MKQKKIPELFDFYKHENWQRNPLDILKECDTVSRKAIVVDLWTLYILTKESWLELFNHFKMVYITHATVNMALQEISQVIDDDVKKVLISLQIAKNIKFQSPTLEQQLKPRTQKYDFMEIHSACLLAKELNCPAFVGDFKFPIPEFLQSNVIRPSNIDAVATCVLSAPMTSLTCIP